MKIVILDKCTVSRNDVSFEEIEALGNVEFFDVVPNDKLHEAIGDADIVVCNKAQITREVMDKCPNLKYVGLFATGYNNIDIEYAKEKGIVVVNVPGYSTDAVAQNAFAMILALSTSLCDYASFVRNEGWVKSKTFSCFPYPIFELSGKTLGIFGYGNIGRQVAKIGKAFNMNVIVYSRTRREDNDVEWVSRDELFCRSDFLSLHAPLTKETERMINRDTISLMKETAYLINTSRGGAIDEEALAEALNTGRLAGAGIDVLTVEPMQPGNPLMTAKNCLITPHVAWAPIETRKRLLGMVADNIKAFIDGNPINVVNK